MNIGTCLTYKPEGEPEPGGDESRFRGLGRVTKTLLGSEESSARGTVTVISNFKYYRRIDFCDRTMPHSK